jgi:subtilisin family serine protease
MFEPKPAPFAHLTGRGVRVAIIDSGVNPAHPHVAGVAGGVRIGAGGEDQVYLDYLGHGTAVAGAIREQAPEALLYAVKVFDRALATDVETIIRAVEWAIAHEMHLINLSLGTLNQKHRERFERVIARASERGAVVVAAYEMSGQASLPGCLPATVGVGLDWQCPRGVYRYLRADSRPIFLASGYPRPIPGVPPDRNLNGISFAVANLTGFVARARQACPDGSAARIESMLIAEAQERVSSEPRLEPA